MAAIPRKMSPKWHASSPGGLLKSLSRAKVSLSKTACTNQAKSGFSAIASNQMVKRKDWRSCIFWPGIPPRQSSCRANSRSVLFPTILRRPLWIAETFRKKDGDIREVLKTMLHSPEFWSADEYRSKVKTPFEFVISALRATGADIGDAVPLARQLQSLGMPLYGMQPPTGYSMKADAWISSAALLG